MHEEGYEQERTRGRTRRTSDCWTLVGVRRGCAETVCKSYACSIYIYILYRVPRGDYAKKPPSLYVPILALATRRRSVTPI